MTAHQTDRITAISRQLPEHNESTYEVGDAHSHLRSFTRVRVLITAGLLRDDCDSSQDAFEEM